MEAVRRPSRRSLGYPSQYFEREVLKLILDEAGEAVAELYPDADEASRGEELCEMFVRMNCVVFEQQDPVASDTVLCEGYKNESEAIQETVQRAVNKYHEGIRVAFENAEYVSKADLKRAHDVGVKESLMLVVNECYNQPEVLDKALKRTRASHTIEIIGIARVNVERRIWEVELKSNRIVKRAGKEILERCNLDQSRPCVGGEDVRKKLNELMEKYEDEFREELASAQDLVGEGKLGKLKLQFKKQVDSLRNEVLTKNVTKLVQAVAEDWHSKYEAEMEGLIARKGIVTKKALENEHFKMREEYVTRFIEDGRLEGAMEEIKNGWVTRFRDMVEETFGKLVTRLEAAVDKVVQGYSRRLQESVISFSASEDQSRDCQIEREVVEKLKANCKNLLEVESMKRLLEDKIVEVTQEIGAQREAQVVERSPCQGSSCSGGYEQQCYIPEQLSGNFQNEQDDSEMEWVGESINTEVEWEWVSIFDTPRRPTSSSIGYTPQQESTMSFTIQLVNLRGIRVGFFLQRTPHILCCNSGVQKNGVEEKSVIPLLVGQTNEDCFVFGDEVVVKLEKNELKDWWDVGEMLRDHWHSNMDAPAAKVGEQEISMKLEILLAMILRNVQRIAEREMSRKYQNVELSKILRVGIVVPSRLIPFQRKQLKDSAKIAGFEESRIVNETSCIVHDKFYSDPSQGDYDNIKNHEILVLTQNTSDKGEPPQLEFVRYKYETHKSCVKIKMEEYTDEKLAGTIPV